MSAGFILSRSIRSWRGFWSRYWTRLRPRMRFLRAVRARSWRHVNWKMENIWWWCIESCDYRLPDTAHKIIGETETSMALIDPKEFLKLAPTILKSPGKLLWTRYDAEADVLYMNFQKPAVATDSELTDDDMIIRYNGDEIVGLTVLHASKR